MLITKNKTAATILKIIFFSLIFSWIYYYSGHHSTEIAKLVKTTDDYLVIQRDTFNGGGYKELYISSKSAIPPLVIGKQYYFVSDQRYFQHPYIRYVEE
ncbi:MULTISPECIES: hypothetical protein [Paenibacillus]|uniref:Uncharacterized protein n=1 Tax=Paenibacillus polymyxa TaxID=1406 RepID=A0A8I1LQL2_PAEPO|nr:MULTISPECIES: hypothetical protein [Paenibacillus]KAF6575742.1 hypothetical protein G9G53_04905 [Paenibacillus sp. EKM206P]KAF6589375.1 hypothetical protein G9G52_08790 [Paenibacillus sp. EKM205P]KEO78880.1 hypothetical protein EL23_10870 [Paenibacillus polymyxa]MBM0633611.1 hypothetical protein [Paenibacillus polymyxa]MCH6187830.1 hypothetical protein [Paenibacillus polymyxa]